MNLMKNFNLNYLIQNLKKSRTILAIFIGLIPILNTIILIMLLTTNKSYVLGLGEISIINLIGIYILPTTISICLFNYIYKKKSVDFINSMPISRKTIYITNTIAGILIFTLMLLINTFLIFITTKIFASPIPFIMLLDYFWFFLLVYIFVFTATNLAMTVSGNAITQIVLTLLLLFLMPYTSFYINTLNEANGKTEITKLECNKEECMPDKYYCYDSTECELDKELNRYSVSLFEDKTTNYTTPFNIFNSLIYPNSTIINNTSVIKMLLLSIIYTILGFILFVKRKMEISETSFKSPHIHALVKSLTLIPFISLAYLIVKGEAPIFIIFATIILLIYYFIYDLITKKSIQNIKLTLLYFVVTLIVITSSILVIDRKENNNKILKYTDIKEVSINLENDGRYFNSTNKKLYTKNKEIIKLVTTSLLNHNDSYHKYILINLKTNTNKEYKTNVSLTEKNYNQLLNLLETEKVYLNYYKNINEDKIYAIKVGDKTYNKNDSTPYLNLIKKEINKLTLKEYLELQHKYRYLNDNYDIKLYTYENHNKKEQTINAYISYDLLNRVVNSNNKHLKDNITPIIPDDYYLYYENAYLEEEYDIDYYVLRSVKQEIYEFVLKNINDKIDMTKEYITFQLQLNSNRYYFTTNKTEEIKQILNNKYIEIKDTEEYLNYYGYGNEKVEYYD